MTGLDGSKRARLLDRVAVVTGGSSGIGKQVCLSLAREGAAVTVVGRSEERTARTVSEIRERNGRSAMGVTADVRSPTDMDEMARRSAERFGKIDILVACAGILRPPGMSLRTLERTSLQEWEEVLATNLTGMFLSLRAVLPYMAKRKSGDIVTVSSKAGKRGVAFDAPYCASKHGVIALTEAVSEEVRAQGIRVQVVVPGNFDTEVWRQNGPIAPPANLPPPERVASLVVEMVCLPRDACWVAPLAEPARTPDRPDWLHGGKPVSAKA